MRSSRRQSRLRAHLLPRPPGPPPSAGPQASHKESEEALQKRLDEVSRELCRSQTSHASLRADAEKAREQQQQMAGEGGVGAGSVRGARAAGTPDSPPVRGRTGVARGRAWAPEGWPWGRGPWGGIWGWGGIWEWARGGRCCHFGLTCCGAHVEPWCSWGCCWPSLPTQSGLEARFGRWLYGPPVLTSHLLKREVVTKPRAPRALGEAGQTVPVRAPQYFWSPCWGLSTPVGARGLAGSEAAGLGPCSGRRDRHSRWIHVDRPQVGSET